MKALIHHNKTGFDGLSVGDKGEQSPASGQVKVRMKTAGLNHRDLFVLTRHKENDAPLIIGSDGAGIVEEIGESVNNVSIGDEVVIIPSLRWKEKSAAPPEDFEVLGLPDDGTIAEFLTIDAAQVAPKPDYLSWKEAGVFSLGALTAYRALFTRGGLKPLQTVFIPGAGSGVATFLIQMAKAAGARVITSSRSEEKRQKAAALGADFVIDSNQAFDKAIEEPVDLVIESVGAATWRQSLHVLKRGGTMVVFGASAGDEVQLNLRDFFYGQYNLLGSTLGSIEEFHEMLEFFNEHKLHPILDQTFSLHDSIQALKRLEEGKQFGKIGITILN